MSRMRQSSWLYCSCKPAVFSKSDYITWCGIAKRSPEAPIERNILSLSDSTEKDSLAMRGYTSSVFHASITADTLLDFHIVIRNVHNFMICKGLFPAHFYTEKTFSPSK